RPRLAVPGDLAGVRRGDDRLPAVRAGPGLAGGELGCRADRLDDLPRPRPDGDRLRHVDVRAGADERGADGLAYLPGAGGRDPARLGRAGRAAALARVRRRRALPDRRDAGPAPPASRRAMIRAWRAGPHRRRRRWTRCRAGSPMSSRRATTPAAT